MSKNIERRAGQLALYEARSLKQYSHIVESARWLTTHRQEELQREYTFGQVIQTINETQDYSGAFRDVLKLKLLTNNESLPTLGQIATRNDDMLFQVIEEVKEKYPAWANENFNSKGTSVWGMIIEGYGMYLGKKFGKSEKTKQHEINRAFVLAFEAVAFTTQRDSTLVNDVIDWMREEKNDFPPEIMSQL